MSGVPPSRRIADDLRQAITTGELLPGDRLPSERSLAQAYGTARNTARQAFAILQAEGLVEAQHGRGVFVRGQPPLVRLGLDRYSRQHRERGKAPFQTEVERQGRTARVHVPEVGPVPAPPIVASRLGIVEGEPVLRRDNIYLADDRPVQLVFTYIPLAIAADGPLTQPEVGPGGIYARLEDRGHRLERMREDVSARMPSPDEVQALALSPGVPVIELLHTSFDQADRPFEVTHFVLPADRNALTYDVPVQ